MIRAQFMRSYCLSHSIMPASYSACIERGVMVSAQHTKSGVLAINSFGAEVAKARRVTALHGLAAPSAAQPFTGTPAVWSLWHY